MKLLDFLFEKSRHFNVLNKIINELDYMGLNPLYLLCEKGYKDKEFKNDPKIGNTNRQHMLTLLLDEKANWTI
jgi:hypothetical protein